MITNCGLKTVRIFHKNIFNFFGVELQLQQYKVFLSKLEKELGTNHFNITLFWRLLFLSACHSVYIAAYCPWKRLTSILLSVLCFLIPWTSCIARALLPSTYIRHTSPSSANSTSTRTVMGTQHRDIYVFQRLISAKKWLKSQRTKRGITRWRRAENEQARDFSERPWMHRHVSCGVALENHAQTVFSSFYDFFYPLKTSFIADSVEAPQGIFSYALIWTKV